MTPLRETIGYILTHNIIYSKQYELIEYGKAGEQLENLMDSEMGKFVEWINENSISNMGNGWVDFGPYPSVFQGTLTTPQLIELYKSRNKI
jgi:hypothetical protein